MKKIISILIIQFSLSTIFANTDIAKIEQQVNQANQNIVKEVVYLLPKDDDCCGTHSFSLYYDNSGNLLKARGYIHEGGVQDAGVSFTEYFGKRSGELIYAFYDKFDSSVSPPKNSGKLYYKNNAVVKFENYAFNYHSQKIAKILPVIKSYKGKHYYKEFLFHKNIELLKKDIKSSGLKKRSGEIRVKYSKGKDLLEKSTIINSCNVILRKSPNTKSKIMYRLFPYNKVKIMQIGEKESIGYWKNEYWYKVKFEISSDELVVGWIYGAFLEPLEIKTK